MSQSQSTDPGVRPRRRWDKRGEERRARWKPRPSLRRLDYSERTTPTSWRRLFPFHFHAINEHGLVEQGSLSLAPRDLGAVTPATDECEWARWQLQGKGWVHGGSSARVMIDITASSSHPIIPVASMIPCVLVLRGNRPLQTFPAKSTSVPEIPDALLKASRVSLEKQRPEPRCWCSLRWPFVKETRSAREGLRGTAGLRQFEKF
ncbi:hypothetical protein K456DRAFT_739451 [Colletotrichum gloeosporioides 23]|nr:hypothetical protein K456DRAFT_739451 [Colletotrichum gloeosporioides 23]